MVPALLEYFSGFLHIIMHNLFFFLLSSGNIFWFLKCPAIKIKSLSVFVQLNNKAIKKHWFLVQGTLKASFTFGCIFFVYYKHLFNLLQFEV